LSRLLWVTVFVGFFPGAVSHGASSTGANADVRASKTRPIVIAHRGASGARPEHTLPAYELALVQGADFIELDLVATRDGVLIARHENALAMAAVDEEGGIIRDADGAPRIREATTDVADRPEFADRLVVKSIDGRPIAGWFSEDFSAREIATLKARERIPRLRPANQRFDDEYPVPTLASVIELVADWEERTGERPGLYIELKHPTYFRDEGRRLDGEPIATDLGVLLLDTLEAHDFLSGDRVFIQSFEVAPLIELKDAMAAAGYDLPLIQLFGDVFNRRFRAMPRDVGFRARRGTTAIYGELETLLEGGIREDLSYAELANPAVLAFMAERYAAGIGPTRSSVLLIDRQPDGRNLYTGRIGPLISDARRAGLVVHPWTLRAEAPFLLDFGDGTLSVVEEAGLLLDAGADGFFIDQPDQGRIAVDRHQRLNRRQRP
jgi:glycerophosphoryl diester phosphodiesterase